jgi:hypothetical protein
LCLNKGGQIKKSNDKKLTHRPYLTEHQAVNKVNGGDGPHPFVLQTYKSTMYFLTSWTVLLLGVEFQFTPWGVVSGLLWVTGGACGIFGIRNAGLAISVGTWSSITVLVSFSWGIFVFGEKVQSTSQTLLGVLMMILGFVGMTYFSSCCSSKSEISSNESSLVAVEGDILEDNVIAELSEPLLENERHATNEPETMEAGESSLHHHDCQNVIEALVSTKCTNNDKGCFAKSQHIVCLGIKWDRKVLGVLGAVVDGILGGSNLVPMKIAPSV